MVASAGATNTGAIDDLAGVAAVCAERRVVAARRRRLRRGRAAVPELAGRFAGIGAADSVVIDPHKWLFAPLDCAALLYREPALARAHPPPVGGYLDAFGDDHVNPSDLAFHLTRRARGLPLWFALVVHGTDAFAAGVRAGVDLARRAAAMVAPGRDRRCAWSWSRSCPSSCSSATAGAAPPGTRGRSDALDDGLAFVTPTTWHGRPTGRLVFLHPHTELAAVADLLARTR